MSFRAFSSRGSSLKQSIAETYVRFDAAHLLINLVSEIAVPMFPTLRQYWNVLPMGMACVGNIIVLTMSYNYAENFINTLCKCICVLFSM